MTNYLLKKIILTNIFLLLILNENINTTHIQHESEQIKLS